jgi:hypothetical protein
MQTKLTLRLDKVLIEQAKQYAEQLGYSLSQLVAEYFAVLTTEHNTGASYKEELPPITRSLVGALKRSEYDQEDYRRHLEEKYR